MTVSLVIREEAWETQPEPRARGSIYWVGTPGRVRQDMFMSLHFLPCFCTCSLSLYNKQIFVLLI